MTERDALLQTIHAYPDDDLPRLVYADWVEEDGDAEYAAFIRAQCELAATPDWEPFAVRCRVRHPEWVHGRPFHSRLPRVDGRLLEWHPDCAFRRGFGHSLIVRQLSVFLDDADRLFAEAPIRELHLPTATLDEWRRFARQPWLPQVRSLHFFGTRTPIEPIRVLSETPLSTGVEEIVFEKSNSPAMSILLDDLLRFPLGGQLKSLELRVGPENIDDLLQTIAGSDARLKRFALVTMPTPIDSEFFQSHALAGLEELTLQNIRSVPLPSLADDLEHLRFLSLAGCRLQDADLYPLFDMGGNLELRSLDLSGNAFEESVCFEATDDFDRAMASLRSLKLRGSCLTSAFVGDWLSDSLMWSNLVELDLAKNPLTDDGALAILNARPQSDLSALTLSGTFSPIVRKLLRDRYQEALILDEGE